ncbi:MAG TPA: transcription termination factor NusA [Thermoanaerobaculia bacterium]|nr:transcription termination factor NusA [Thermoanaerobaculia bacterium]HQR68349.1 transcription termination factor NusA [Thermoanaerobaculia bacterium]
MDSTQAPTKGDAPGGKTARGKGARAPKAGKAKAGKPAKPAKAPPTTKADEIIEALRAASRDKDIGFERLVAALEEAIATAARKVYKVREMAARFDAKAGTLTAWTPYRIVDQKTKIEPPPAPAEIDPDDIPLGQAAPAPLPAPLEGEPEKEIRLPWIEVLPDEAHALLEGELAGQSWQVFRYPEGEGGPEEAISAEQMTVGDEIRLYRSTEGLGRIAAQSAKQVLYQKVREAERENIYNEYYPKVGELITGTVKRFERGDMIVDLGRTEAVIPREHQSRAERYTQGERVRAVLADVHKNPKGAQLVLSRTAPELLMQLMKMEVPEIYDETVVIRGCVRQPGDRAKVAVASRERDVDPVGACVGMRGARVQAIMRELRGERIDIIQYSDDLVTYAQNALAPAKITRVSVMPGDEDEAPEIGPDGEELEPLPTLECIVEEDQLSLAIGKRGQNVRLAAALIGARIEIKSEQAVKAEVAEALQRMLLSSQRRATALTEVPGIDEAAAAALAAQGLATVGDLLEAGSGADEEKAGALREAALEPEAKDAALEAAREFEEAPAPEPEPEPDEEAVLETADETEGETEPTEDGGDAAEAAPVAETPEK